MLGYGYALHEIVASMRPGRERPGTGRICSEPLVKS